MTIPKTVEVTTDQARNAFCEAIAKSCEQGVTTIKIRINTSGNGTPEICFYERSEGDWKKTEPHLGHEFVEPIRQELERLAACPHAEDSQVRQNEFADRVEFDLKFDPQKIRAQQGRNLFSYLFGVLFRER